MGEVSLIKRYYKHRNSAVLVVVVVVVCFGLGTSLRQGCGAGGDVRPADSSAVLWARRPQARELQRKHREMSERLKVGLVDGGLGWEAADWRGRGTLRLRPSR